MNRTMLVVGLAALVGCAGVSKDKYKAKEAEAAKYKQSSEEQGARATALENKVSTLEQQNSTLQTQNQDLEGKLSETTTAKAALLEKTPLRVNQQLLFKENSSKLTPESKRTLDSVAEAIIAQSKDKSVIVAGHTDNSEGGKHADAKRWQLSSSRALEVAKYLAGRGLDPSLIAVAGFGPARPIAPNDSLANKALNRRVEITLAPAKMDTKTIEVRPPELTPKK